MTDKIVDWLIANSPIEPILAMAAILTVFFPLFYWKDVKRWNSLGRREKSRVVGSILVIVVLLIVGFGVSSNK